MIGSSVCQAPCATYRLQLMQPGRALRFDDVRTLIDYLHELGVGALYLSPFFRARLHSTHGYDVVDPTQFSPHLGDERSFQELADAARQVGLGMIADVVPNHMGIDDPHNGWWQDILENGSGSIYAKYFEIDWRPPKTTLQGKVLLPVLGDPFGRALEDQQLQLIYAEQRFAIAYHERRLPTDPCSWIGILQLMLEILPPSIASDAPERMELESIVTALRHLPSRDDPAAEAVQQRNREKEVAQRRLAALVDGSEAVRQALQQTLSTFNGQRGVPHSFDRLEALLAEQPYRLSFWRVATDEINYRRFFDVDFLAAIRIEDADVFQAVHALVLRLVERGWLTGMRIDHADGLLDPQKYLAMLAGAVAGNAPAAPTQSAPNSSSPPQAPWIVVEKILARDESLPADWPVQGTTGYDFLNLLNGLFVEPRGMLALREIYAEFSQQGSSYPQVLYESKRTILTSSLSSELYQLSHRLNRIAERQRQSCDFTRPSLYRALREVVACFPVYRTYIRPATGQVSDADRRSIMQAVRSAKRRNPAMSSTFFDFVASILLLDQPLGLSDDQVQERHEFVEKFQQLTGPVTAKGLEDTSFYRFYPLASLNEVGGDATSNGTSIEAFHRRLRDRQQREPRSQSATATHDTKWGEDIRARLNVLSELPEQWNAAIRRWETMNATARTELEGAAAPDANEEYLLYQTLVGTWPTTSLSSDERAAYVERIVKYMEKALHEAKLHTSWLNPDLEYEQAVSSFIRTILREVQNPFVADLNAFVSSVANAGFVNSLAQTAIKIIAPGLPDFYQGTEFWDFHLVDPDNRQPVDFDRRRRMLAEFAALDEQHRSRLADELLRAWPDERLKLFVTWRLLSIRRSHPALFAGDYIPLASTGHRAANVLAFARHTSHEWAICLTPRLAAAAWRSGYDAPRKSALTRAVWAPAAWFRETQVQLPLGAPERWLHAINGRSLSVPCGADGARTVEVAEVLEHFPVAVLVSQSNR